MSLSGKKFKTLFAQQENPSLLAILVSNKEVILEHSSAMVQRGWFTLWSFLAHQMV